MNLSPDMSGQVPDEHRAAYKAAGAWANACYGASNTVSSTSGTAGATRLLLGPLPAAIDRVMLQEDQQYGERVLAYSLLNNATGAVLGNGTAVGHKRIQLLGTPVEAGVTLELRVEDFLDAPVLLNFAAFGPGPCGA